MSKLSLPVINFDGKTLSSLDASPAIFGTEPNEAVVHFACEGQRFSFYKRTACSKTRSAVSGGGKKIRQQKGSGGARQGGNRAPHWVGGGVVFGPAPILRGFKVNKKIKKAALVSVLSDRYSGGQIRVLRSDLKKPAAKTVSGLLSALSLSSARVGVVVSKGSDQLLLKSARNLKNVDVLSEEKWTCLDFIKTDTLIFSEAAYASLTKRLETES
ncbi:MAG: 50S ribosomal protein L4 [Bdellovibrionales bacterium]|nr:50S ribosomal protein L4 [Bdellovibrionales bacterium]